MTQVEKVWQCFVSSISNSADWCGWFLYYFTKHCLHLSMNRQDEKDPFKLNQMRSIEQLRNKLPARNLHELLNELNNVVCFQTQ